MKRFNFLTIMIMIVMLLPISVTTYAQTVSLPYFCGFEDAAENANWVLNAGPAGNNAVNKWYVSDAEVYAGDSALNISNTGGTTATYGNTPVAIVAYRDITLPAGTYDLSFTYNAGGEDNVDGLYACWVSGTTATNSSAMSAPQWVTSTAFTINNTKMQSLTDGWRVATQTITSTGVAMKLVFVWVNNGGNATPPGGCIDNVQIASTSGCAKPANVTATANGSTVVVTWSGSADSYDLMYRSYGKRDVTTVTGITGNSYTINGLGEGVYDFMVRSNCSGDTSIYVIEQNLVVYDPDAHCIDFRDLTGPGTTCTYGTYDNPTQTTGVIDNGPDQMSSRHTVHYTPGETDPRTLNGLTTIPKGEVVSVRLGNWNNGSEAETVTYTYTVPANSNNIMIIKYAIVFEEPGHSQPPEFNMQITNISGQSIGSCTEANFQEGTLTGATWHICQAPGSYGTLSTIWWKEWTNVGFNLSQYAGQTLNIKFTTKDCNASGHFGYAYYTISCVNAEITGVLSDSGESTKYNAPDGFNYQWINNCTGQTAATTRSISLTSDSCMSYTCICSNKESSGCTFTLTALVPSFPESSFSYSMTYSECQTHINFTNNSQAYKLSNGVRSYIGYSDISNQTWNVQTKYSNRQYYDMTSTDKNLGTIDVPSEGDTINVTLTSWVGNKYHDTTVTIYVPALPEYHTVTDSNVCIGTPIIIGDVQYTFVTRDSIEVLGNGHKSYITGQDCLHISNNFKTMRGCDSINEYNYRPMLADTIQIDTTLRDGETYCLTVKDPTGGILLDTCVNNVGQHWFHIPNSIGCDSILYVVTITTDTITSVDNVSDLYEISLWPNPIHIGETAYLSTDKDVAMVEVYNSQGQCVNRTESVSGQVAIDGLPTAGVYIVRVTNKDGIYEVFKLIVE